MPAFRRSAFGTERNSERTASSLIAANKSKIIREWMQQLSLAQPQFEHFSKPALVNAVPDWLDRLAEQMESPEASFGMEKVILSSKEHSRERAQVRVELDELLLEYAVLQDVILKLLEKNGLLSTDCRDLVLNVIQVSIRMAAVEFLKAQTNRWKSSILTQGTHPRSMTAVAISVGIVACASLIQWLAWPLLKPLGYILYYPSVILASLYGNAWVAIGLSLVLAHFIFIPPELSFEIRDWTDLVRAGAYFGSVTAIAIIVGKLKRAWLLAKDSFNKQEGARSIAERLADEARLAKLEGEAVLAELQEEKELRDRMISSISHDLRGTLTLARMSIELQRRYLLDPQLIEQFLGKSQIRIDRANRLIENLLDANRLRAGEKLRLKISEFDLIKVIKSALEGLRLSYGDRFILEGPLSLTGVWSEEGVYRIVENLCNNAVKYGSPALPIRIRITEQTDKVTLCFHNEDSYIPPESQKTFFALFQTGQGKLTKGKGGWGIGLSIVHGIVTALGGKVTIASDQAKGTDFIVELPMNALQAKERQHKGLELI